MQVLSMYVQRGYVEKVLRNQIDFSSTTAFVPLSDLSMDAPFSISILVRKCQRFAMRQHTFPFIMRLILLLTTEFDRSVNLSKWHFYSLFSNSWREKGKKRRGNADERNA